MFKFKFWKLTTFVLLILLIFVIKSYLKEARKNQPYKQQLANLEKFLARSKEEAYARQRKIISQQDTMNQEKELKDKLGQVLEGEKMIIVSDEVLKTVILPIDFNQPE
jgi:site-specific recombinase